MNNTHKRASVHMHDAFANGRKMDGAILTNVIWQGCKHMVDQANKDEQRRDYFENQILNSLFYMYIIMGYDKVKANEQAAAALDLMYNEAELQMADSAKSTNE